MEKLSCPNSNKLPMKYLNPVKSIIPDIMYKTTTSSSESGNMLSIIITRSILKHCLYLEDDEVIMRHLSIFYSFNLKFDFK